MSTPIQLMINGLPGNVAQIIARHAQGAADMELLPYSFTGPDIDDAHVTVEGKTIRLIKPQMRDEAIGEIKAAHGQFISVDFTHPAAINENAEFYCRNSLPFVMGTTGGDREKLAETVNRSEICAVIAPNMAKPIVGFQAMMAYAAENFPGVFRGFTMTLTESHQKGKADTSGTAKAMIGYFNQMGVPFDADEIVKIREPEIQKNTLGVPEAYIGGHGWHTYTLLSEDETVRFVFRHDVNGREIYGDGTLDAARFLSKKLAENNAGKVFSMIDVLKGDV